MNLLELYGAKTHGDLVKWIATQYGLGSGNGHRNVHRIRREEIARRVRLYRDDAKSDFEQIIRQVFEDEIVQLQRMRLIDVACEQNVTRRIIDEVASLYDKPAVRTLANAAEDKRFHEEERRLNLHEIMQETHRLLQLCNEVLVWQFAGVDTKARLRVVTPDVFDALPDPRDLSVMAGVVIDTCPMSIAPDRDKLPHYEIWDDTYRYQLSASGELLAAPMEHGLGRIPGVLLHKRQPTDRLLDNRPGRDITSAHLGIGLLNVMIMRLSKSQGERQPILKGNLANVAKNQRLDGENPIALPPEVEMMMLDSKTDPDHYIAVKVEKLSSLGVTYGLSYEQMTYKQAPTSGKEWMARREKLTELRGEQRRRALVNEAEVIDLVGFSPEGMKVDHSEQSMPQDAIEEIDLLERKMKHGLDSPVKYMRRKNPDHDVELALIEIRENLGERALVVGAARALNMPDDASAENPGKSPEENGADNAKKGEPDLRKLAREVLNAQS
jgi:hypothetical protein